MALDLSNLQTADWQLSELQTTVADLSPYPLVFATLEGDRLYGTVTSDSAYAAYPIVGAYVLPLTEVIGLDLGAETLHTTGADHQKPVDLSAHDIKKLCVLLLTNNASVLEHLYSPLVIHSTPEHEELMTIAQRCITRHHSYYYAGLASNHWHLCIAQTNHPLQPLLYAYRSLLTGIYLMQSGHLEFNLTTLADSLGLSRITELACQWQEGHTTVPSDQLTSHQLEYKRLQRYLTEVSQTSSLPDVPTAKDDLHRWLVRSRLHYSPN